MRCLVAARLSRLSDGSTGLEKQDEAPRRHADLQGWEVVAVAADTDVSGDTDPWSRPELGPWLSDPARIDSYDAIVATHVDRLARSTVHFMRLLHWADEHGKRIITVGEAGIDFGSPVGKLLGYIISWLGEQELASIKRRYRETQAWLREHGFLVGKPTWGWMIVPHPGDAERKTLVLDPALRDWADGMVERGLRGDSYESIARWLTSEGVPAPSGGVWWARIVKAWLRNPILYGRRMSADGQTVLKVEPLIDYATWKRLQEATGGKRSPGKMGDDHLLSGVLYCPRCRRAMYFSRKVARGQEYRYMRCVGRRGERSTCRNAVREDAVLTWLEEDFIPEFGSREIRERVKVPGSGHAEEIELVEHDIRALDLDDPRYDEKLAEMRAERSRLKAAPPEPDRIEDRPTGVTVAERWASLDEAGKRGFLLHAGVRIYASKEHDGHVDIHSETEHPEILWSH